MADVSNSGPSGPEFVVASTDIQVKEHDFGDDWESSYSQHAGYGRRPVIFDEKTNHLHVGPPGASHGELHDHVDPNESPGWLLGRPEGWIGHNVEGYDGGSQEDREYEGHEDEEDYYDAIHKTPKNLEYGWYGGQQGLPRPPVRAHEALKAFAESQGEAKHQEGWHFARMEKVADKLNDFLMNPKSRPDLQTPQAQNFLADMQRNYHNPQTDAMMPWLTREWKKNRLTANPQNPGTYEFTGSEESALGGQVHLTPQRLNHWASWYASNHPTRQGVDLMQHKVHDIDDKIADWEITRSREEKAKRAQGEVVHQLPNKWTVQKLNTPDSLTHEGDQMGHCVGGYNGEDTKIYSLRDEKNQPHVTMEVEHPDRWKEGLSPVPEAQWKDPEEYEKILNHPDNQHHIQEHQDRVDHRHQMMTEDGEWPELAARGPADVRELLRRQNTVQSPLSAGALETHNKLVPPIVPEDTRRKIGPHEGEIKQIQGKGNSIPKPEYQAMIKHWMESMPEEERPSWPDQDETYSSAEDMLPGGNGGVEGGYRPHGDYGVGGGKPNYDWHSIIKDFHDHSGFHDPEDLAEGIAAHIGHLPPDEKTHHAREIADTLQNRYRQEHEDAEWRKDQSVDNARSYGELDQYMDDFHKTPKDYENEGLDEYDAYEKWKEDKRDWDAEQEEAAERHYRLDYLDHDEEYQPQIDHLDRLHDALRYAHGIIPKHSRPLISSRGPVVPDLPGAKPWRPGLHGKGYQAQDGTVYHWHNSDPGAGTGDIFDDEPPADYTDIHHDHVIRHVDPHDTLKDAYSRAFMIDPDGGLSSADILEDSSSSTRLPQIAEHHPYWHHSTGWSFA